MRPLEAPESARRRRRFRYWPVAFVIALGCLASFWAFEANWRANLRATEIELRTRLQQRHHAIADALQRYENLIDGVRVYLEGTGGRQDEREFAAVVAGLLKAHRGIHALDYAPHVPAARRADYEAEQRRRGRSTRIFDRLSDGMPVPAGERSEYFPLRDVVPSVGNEILFGLDLAVDQPAMLERARDSGGLVATGPIRLLRKEAGGHWGLLVAAPVYNSAADSGTLENRRANLIGFAIGAFRIGELVEAVLPDTTLEQNAYDQYLFYGIGTDPAKLVYTHSSRLRGGGEAPPLATVPAALGFTDTLVLAGQDWTLVTVPLFHSEAPRGDDWRTLAFGLLLTGFVALYLVGALRRTEALRAGAEALSKEVEDRGRAELRAQRERDAAQGYLDVADVMILALARDGKVSLINRKGAEVLACADVEILGRDWNEVFIPPRLQQQARDRFLQLIASPGGDSQCFELPVLARSGEERVIAWRATALVDVEGRCSGILQSGEDVTDRRRAELQLRQSEARFRMLVEQAPDAIVVYDFDRDRFVDANRNATLLFGCSRERLLQLGSAHFYSPRQPDGRPPEQTFREYGGRALAGETLVFERAIRNADGKDLICEVRLAPLPSDSGRLLRASYLDVTDRIRAEEKLQFANTLLTAGMESSPDGILVVDDAGRILSFNRRFTELWHLPAAVLASGDDAPLLSAVAAQVRHTECFLETVRYLYDHPEERSHDELELVDGRFLDRWSESLITEDGSYLGRIWFFRDITGRKRTDAQIARAPPGPAELASA